jgi:hypothetical protein
VYIFGEIEDALKAIGKIIKWMVKVFSIGRIKGDMKELIERIKKKALVFSNGKSI